MKKLIFILICLNSLTGHTQNWDSINPPRTNSGYKTSIVNKNVIYIYCRSVDSNFSFLGYKTTDSGKSWIGYQNRKYIGDFWFNDSTGIFSLNKTENSGFNLVSFNIPGGTSGLILNLQNKTDVYGLNKNQTYKFKPDGSNWHKVCDTSLYNIQFVDSIHGFSTDFNTKILFKTSNNGESWQSFYNNLTPSLVQLQFVNQDTAYVLFSNDKLARTINGGKTWDTIYKPKLDGSAIYGFGFGNGSIGYLLKSNYEVLKTKTAGNNWFSVYHNSCQTNKIRVIDENVVFIYSEGMGTTCIYKTTNGGGNWIADEPKPISSFDLYPNPTTNNLNIEWQNTFQNNPKATIMIYNSFGQQVYSEQTSNKKLTINVATWQKGIYFVKYLNINQNEVRKFVVE